MTKAYLQSTCDLNEPDIVSGIDDLPLWSAPFGLKLLEVVKLGTDLNVLDIGSGTGFPMIELSQRLRNTCKVYGIDPWTEAVERILRTNSKLTEIESKRRTEPDHTMDLYR